MMGEPYELPIRRFHIKNEVLIKNMPASIKRHHCWPGGWETHTLEVMNNVFMIHQNLCMSEESLTQCPLNEILTAAYIHDIDKVVYRYEEDDTPPTYAQIKKAQMDGIEIHEKENKTSIGMKIGMMSEEGSIDPSRIGYHRWKKKALSLEDGAAVAWIAAKNLIPMTDRMLHAVCFHHGGYNPYVREMPATELNPMATILHAADILSSKIQNGNIGNQQ